MKRLNDLVMKRILPFGILLLMLIGSGTGFGQEKKRVILDENTFQKFQLAKRMFEKGQVFFLNGKYQKSEKALKECLKGFPEYSQAYYYLAQIYYKKEDFPKALENIEHAKATYEVMSDLLISAQQRFLNELRRQKTLLQENLIDLTDPDDIDEVKTSLANINARLNEPLPVLPKKSANYFYYHGNIFMKLRKYNEAHAQYLEALKIDPKHGKASNNLANIYFMVKKYDKALYYLTQAEANGAEINPRFKEAIQKAMQKKN
jgi:tetratricopeptide (TPR) repeat protein